MSIPRRDPNVGSEQLKKAAEKFRDAGMQYWETAHKSGLVEGAVVWVKMEDGCLVAFTRGEYSEQIINALRRIEGPTTEYGWTNP